MDAKPKICVVGAGNASHVFMADLAHRGYAVDVFEGYGNQAERLNEALDEGGGIRVVDRSAPGDVREYTARPALVSSDPAEVVPDSDVILMPLPSFAFPDVLRAIRPHLAPGTTIFGMPGQGGLDLVATEELADEIAGGSLTVAGIVPLPLNCRIEEFGRRVDLAAFKDSYDLAAVPAQGAPAAARLLSGLLERPVRALGHYAAITLHASNPNIHPGRLYGLFGDHAEGSVYPTNPLFYETFDDVSARWCERISDERIAVWNALVEKTGGRIGRPGEVPDIKTYIENIYGDQIRDTSTTATVFSSNDGFRGFRCPMKPAGDGWTLDFDNRYFTEDIPEAFCAYKGMADLAGVDTPAIDEILAFFQRHMGKEYLRGGRLAGRDVGETKAPQAFGIHTLEDYLARLPGPA
ncbi:MAG TPA: NAD/NADP octopine/nopaline dehydrogenase family protein [Polyangiaceae bacterium LLY-WYZ-14_1]|nr:NAD/NADP octopine/nopaline dehydrogenase family protein [Polyangiaceae bacterium LLY-WYZ-14_1]